MAQKEPKAQEREKTACRGTDQDVSRTSVGPTAKRPTRSLPLEADEAGRLSRLLFDELPRRSQRRQLVPVVGDVVAVEHRVGLVASHPHRDRLGTPPRIMLRAAVWRKSWKCLPMYTTTPFSFFTQRPSPAFTQAALHCFPKVFRLMTFP